MHEEKSVPALRLIVPLPIALYSSNGLLFELYEGGQPSRRHHIVWERVKTTEEHSSIPFFVGGVYKLYPRLISISLDF